MTRYAPLTGWIAHPTLRGWLRHPDAPGWLRTRDGRWWSEAEVREGRLVMSSDGPMLARGWLLDPQGNWIRENVNEPGELENLRIALQGMD